MRVLFSSINLVMQTFEYREEEQISTVRFCKNSDVRVFFVRCTGISKQIQQSLQYPDYLYLDSGCLGLVRMRCEVSKQLSGWLSGHSPIHSAHKYP